MLGINHKQSVKMLHPSVKVITDKVIVTLILYVKFHFFRYIHEYQFLG